MKKTAIFLALTAAILGAGFYYLKARHETIAVVKLLRGPAVQIVYASGTVEPSVMIPIAPRQSARLMALMADEGTSVKKGDVLGQLEDDDLGHARDELRSKADLAQKDYARKLSLLKSKAISQEAYDSAKTTRDAAKAALERAEAELSYLRLIAPEDGLVIRRDGEVGEMIQSGEAVFWMSCCAPLRIAAEVDEEDISLVKPGQKVLISADAFPDQVFDGTVTSITPKGDSIARSYRVRIGLDEKAPLMIGMTAETNIIISQNENALLAPTASLKNGMVYVVENDTVKSVRVETGAQSTIATEIKTGLDENSFVIMDASGNFQDGDKVSTVLKKWSVD
jgi:multidrug efflux system membrane fusion protein